MTLQSQEWLKFIYEMNLHHWNLVGVLKVIALGVINEMKRLCFGGSLSHAVFCEKLFLLQKNTKNLKNMFFL